MPYALARLNHPLSAVYMRQWTGSVFRQVMVCHFFGEKPLPEPIMDFCQLDPKEQTGGIRIKIQNFSFMKILLKISSEKWRPFCAGWDELMTMA